MNTKSMRTMLFELAFVADFVALVITALLLMTGVLINFIFSDKIVSENIMNVAAVLGLIEIFAIVVLMVGIAASSLNDSGS